MNPNTATPSAAALRHLCASIAIDLAQAPLRSDNYRKLAHLTNQFLALEKSMTTTSDMVTAAFQNANDLLQEAVTWESIAEEGGTLRNAMDQSMTRVAGTTEAAVSSHVAHP